jgi:hypothetical protein
MLKPGSRWKSVACSAEIVVVRPPSAEGALYCGGAEMAALGTEAAAQPLDPSASGGVAIGKRYVDEPSGLEVLGSKAGAGALFFDGRPLRMKEAKPLPASD